MPKRALSVRVHAQWLAFCSLLLITPLAQVRSAEPGFANDPLEPIASARGANAGPLSGALLVTRDLEMLRRAYVDGVGLTLTGPLPVNPRLRALQRRL